MLITNDHSAMVAGNSRMPFGSGAFPMTVAAEKARAFHALRMTVAAMLFVVASFFSFGADVSVAQAKTAAKGKSTKTIKAKATKAKAVKAKKAKTVKAKASKKKVAISKAALKAQSAKAKLALRSKKATAKAMANKATAQSKQVVQRVTKNAVKTLGGQWGLLNQYKRDLASYGKQKLEGWSEKMAGTASWYGTFFHGRLTASGRRFNKYADIAAHRSLPFGTILKVTNKDNGKSAIVEVLDRGPYVHDRLIDLSQGTATKLGFMGTGTANVETEILKLGDLAYKVEAPLTAAELRGNVIRHQIDLTGIDLNRSETFTALDFQQGSLRFGALLPEVKPDMDALAHMDSAQIIALEASISRA